MNHSDLINSNDLQLNNSIPASLLCLRNANKICFHIVELKIKFFLLVGSSTLVLLRLADRKQCHEVC
jgi:hypothetical protein